MGMLLSVGMLFSAAFLLFARTLLGTVAMTVAATAPAAPATAPAFASFTLLALALAALRPARLLLARARLMQAAGSAFLALRRLLLLTFGAAGLVAPFAAVLLLAAAPAS